MKKLLACGLILSTLASFGGMCLAAGVNDPDFRCSVVGKKNYAPGLMDSIRTFSFSHKFSDGVMRTVHVRNMGLLEDPRCRVKILMRNDSVYDIVSCWAGFGFCSYMGYDQYVSCDCDTKGKRVLCYDAFINIGDGIWHKTSSEWYPTDWTIEETIRSKPQYKYEITFEDGTQETVKFMGSELLEAPAGELDMGVVCLRNIRVSPPPFPSSSSTLRPEIEIY